MFPSSPGASFHLNWRAALPRRKDGGAWAVEALAQRPLKASWSQGLREPLRHNPHGVGLCIDAVPAGEAPSRESAIGIGQDREAGPQIVPENVQVNGLQKGR